MDIINQIGTFDLENYGDLLYPIVLERFLRRQALPHGVRHYSLIGGKAPQHGGYETSPVKELIEAAQRDRSVIVVGGGDLVRTDWDVIAAHYAKVSRRQVNRLRPTAIAEFVDYRVTQHLPIAGGNKLFAQRFKRRRMNYPAVGPFLLDPANFFPGSSVSYLSCGVPHSFISQEKDEVAEVFERAQFVYVRDEQSAEKLRQAGIRRELHVAPDLTVLLSEQFDRATEANRGREKLAQFGLDAKRPFLCFQSQPYPGFREEDIVKQLEQYRSETQSEIVLLPIGFCHDDHKFLRNLAKQSRGLLKYLELHSIFDIISVIAASDIFIGTSLHGNITAFSFGIPHLFGPLPVDKTDGFLRVVGLPAEFKLRSWREMREKLEMAKARAGDWPVLAQRAQARVRAVTNALLQNILK